MENILTNIRRMVRITKLQKENEALRKQLTNTRMMIGAIVKESGGSITVQDSTLVELDPGDTIVHETGFGGFSRLEYRQKGGQAKKTTPKKTSGGVR